MSILIDSVFTLFEVLPLKLPISKIILWSQIPHFLLLQPESLSL